MLPLLIYAQVYDFPLLWDDESADMQGHMFHPFVISPSLSSFGRLFPEPYFGMYIPVSYLFWSGLKGFAELLSLPINNVLHLSNMGVHIINGLLVFTALSAFKQIPVWHK